MLALARQLRKLGNASLPEHAKRAGHPARGIRPRRHAEEGLYPEGVRSGDGRMPKPERDQMFSQKKSTAFLRMPILAT